MADRGYMLSEDAFNRTRRVVTDSERHARRTLPPIQKRRVITSRGGSGVQIIRFRLSDDVECDNCAANAIVLSRPEGSSTVEGEDPYTNEVRVVDFTGCWLVDPPSDLAGRVGYAVLLRGPRPLSCEPEGGEEVYGRTQTRWEIMYLCPPENTCGAAFEF